MSQLRSAYRTRDKAFRNALRRHDTDRWLSLWYPYGWCRECLQEAGRPCLDLARRSTTVHLADPHQGRPTAPPEQT